MPAVRIRALDRAVLDETGLGVGAELFDVAQQHLRRGQSADEELEEERVACAGLDGLEPRVQCGLSVARDAVHMLVGAGRLRQPRTPRETEPNGAGEGRQEAAPGGPP